MKPHAAVAFFLAAVCACTASACAAPKASGPTVARLLDDPTSVTVLVERASKDPVRRSLGRGAAIRLAAALKALPSVPPGTYNCPADTGKSEDVLTFLARSGRVVATDDVQGCRWVSFQPRSTDPLGVSDQYGTFNRLVLEAVGLPTNYTPL